jgi:hypothetical protein
MQRPVDCRELIFPLRTDAIELASVICASYPEALTKSELAALKDIKVQERVPYRDRSYWKRFWHLDGVAKLISFCRANPHVTVRVLLEAFCIQPGGMVEEVAELALGKKVVVGVKGRLDDRVIALGVARNMDKIMC